MAEIPQSEPELRSDINELPFTDIQRGDVILVETHWFILKEERRSTYTIKIEGIRKTGLQVRVGIFNIGRPNEEFTARFPGVIAVNVKDGEPIKVLRVSDKKEQYKLLFENIHDSQGERSSKSMASADIEQIILIRKPK